MRSTAIKVAAGLVLAAIAISAQTPVPAAQPAGAPASSFDLYFIGHKIGLETTTVTRDAAGAHFQTKFHFDDRNTPIDLTASLDVRSNGEPAKLTVKGRNYRLFQSDSEVTLADGVARVRDLAETSTVDYAKKPFFPIDNYAPIHVQQELIRYWIAKGRPAEIASAPSGPIRIKSRGLIVSESLDGNPSATVEHLSIDGAVWGTETALIDRNTQQLLGVATWAGALPFQAIATGSTVQIGGLLQTAARSDVQDLVEMTTALNARPVRVIRNATIIDGTGRSPYRGVIAIRDGVIESVDENGPEDVEGIDARGKWVIPGLWDMHAHASQTDWAPVYLAAGVTTIRDLGGDNRMLVAIRDAIASGRALGPRYLLAGLIDGPGPRAFGEISVSTPDEALAAVREYKKQGFDEIKVYIQTPPALVPVITAEAHKLGMTVTGHVPQGMTSQQVVEAGYDGIAHMQLRGQPGSAQANQLIEFFKAHKTVMDPTMSWNELSGRPAARPLNDMLPGADGQPLPLARMFRSMSPGNGNSQLAGLQLLRQARDAGLLVVPGTDKGVPGLSLQRELELYVQGGMTPLEAIEAGSIDSARAMKLDSEVGTIEPGKRADFIILDADPLEDIANIRKASLVVKSGVLYRTAELWKLAGYAVR